MAGIPFDIRTRAPWTKQPQDQWLEVNSLEAARNAIPPGARVLLALGSQLIGVFASRADVHFIVRMVDPPNAPLPLPDYELVIGMPGNAEAEAAMLTRHGVTHIVCRNSGGDGAYAKLEAARAMAVAVLMIAMPGIVVV